MSAEKIIEQIKIDSEKEIKKIEKELDKEIQKIKSISKKESEEEVDKIKSQGKKEAQNEKKILISQAHQELNRKLMNTREEMIDKCFNNALEKLKNLTKSEYQKISENLMKKGMQKISGERKVYISRIQDKEIAKKLGIVVAGEIESIGGIIIASKDGKITVDNTFEGIIKREKQKIRNKIGKILFS